MLFNSFLDTPLFTMAFSVWLVYGLAVIVDRFNIVQACKRTRR